MSTENCFYDEVPDNGDTLTNIIKQELVYLNAETTAEKRAELITLFRLCGSLHIVARNIVLEANFENREPALRYGRFLYDVYQISPEILKVKGTRLKHKLNYIVRVSENGTAFARQVGFIDHKGRPIAGFPPGAISNSHDETCAMLRGAFLARGSLARPNRSIALEITCGNIETALTIVGALRRMGIESKTRDVKNGTRIVVRDTDDITTFLDQIGATNSKKLWVKFQSSRKIKAGVNRKNNFDSANLKRSANAAAINVTRIKRAFEILDENEVSPQLVQACKLRLEHKYVSLEELGKLADPPLTKDTIAGRIRRLIDTADKKAHEQGIKDTWAYLKVNENNEVQIIEDDEADE